MFRDYVLSVVWERFCIEFVGGYVIDGYINE